MFGFQASSSATKLQVGCNLLLFTLIVSLNPHLRKKTLQAALEKELEQHCRDQRAALASRLRKRKATKEESLHRAGAGEEETAAAMQALEFEAER